MLNNKLEDPQITIQQFWNLYVLDALLGNFDRHGGNWGFIKVNNRYSLAPIFDNGSCLYPNMTDIEEMKMIMMSKHETDLRVYKFPTSQIRLDGKKSSYFDVISSLRFAECNQALKRIYELYNQDKINFIIDKIDMICDEHKQFYKYIIQKRYEMIIKESYERLENERTSY